MKKVVVILLVLAAAASVAGCILGSTALNAFAGNTLRGSGKIVSKTLPAPDFQAIDASRAVKVLVSDIATQITVEADDNLIDLVTVKLNGTTLEVSLDRSVKNVSSYDVTVIVPANGKICSLHASSASRIVAKAVLAADTFQIEASSAACVEASVKAASCSLEASSASKIAATLDVTSCSIDLSSAAKAAVSGKADECRADLSSASKLSAGDFEVAEFKVGTSSAAKAVVACTKRLYADASSGSSIRYSGDCEATINKSSGGSVSKK